MTRRSRTILSAAALLGGGAFLYGVVHLLMLRFEAGDIYPPYSSLRTDPLGTKALYESLREVGGLTVRRNFRPLDKLEAARGRTLLYLGAGGREGLNPPEGLADGLAKFVSAGGRLVISVSAQTASSGVIAEPGLVPYAAAPWDLTELARKFAFSVELDPRAAAEEWKHLTALRRQDGLGTEADAPWPSPLHFEKPASEWRTIYAAHDKAVVIERTYGRGTVVACADSYFLSNEALRDQRRPGLVAWLVGGRDVVFDETHLGSLQETGVATLARQYNLAGTFFALVLLAGLLVWKNAASLLPRDAARTEQLSGAGVVGRGSAGGLVNLLRKSVPPAKLLSVCLAEWSRASGPQRPEQRLLRKQVEAAVAAEQARPPKNRNPLAAYREICRILAQRKRNRQG